jgi:hypothetical protein
MGTKTTKSIGFSKPRKSMSMSNSRFKFQNKNKNTTGAKQKIQQDFIAKII